MPSAHRARPRSDRPSRPKTPPSPLPPPYRAPAPVALGEDPHAHIVCRNCGRIQGLELTELDRHLLTELASRTPDGWTVERIAYSLTGACRRCREGPAAP